MQFVKDALEVLYVIIKDFGVHVDIINVYQRLFPSEFPEDHVHEPLERVGGVAKAHVHCVKVKQSFAVDKR